MNIQWPEAQTVEVLDGILDAVGREFKINVKTTGQPCPICLSSGYLDPVTNTSIWSFCPTCQGSYYINIMSGILMSGHIRWRSSQISNWNAGGIIPDGDCLITVTYSDELRSSIESAHNFEVDSKKLSLKSYAIKGAKHPNRIILTLKQEAN